VGEASGERRGDEPHRRTGAQQYPELFRGEPSSFEKRRHERRGDAECGVHERIEHNETVQDAHVMPRRPDSCSTTGQARVAPVSVRHGPRELHECGVWWAESLGRSTAVALDWKVWAM